MFGIHPDFFTRTRVKVDKKNAVLDGLKDCIQSLIQPSVIIHASTSFDELKNTIHSFIDSAGRQRIQELTPKKLALFKPGKNDDQEYNCDIFEKIKKSQSKNIDTLLAYAKSQEEVNKICQTLKNQIKTSFETEARQFLATKGIPHDHINQLTAENLEQLFNLTYKFKYEDQNAVWNLVKDICAMNNYNGSDTIIEHFSKTKSLGAAQELCERFKDTRHIKNAIVQRIIAKFKLENPAHGNTLALNLLKTLPFEKLVEAAEDSKPKNFNNLIVELLKNNKFLNDRGTNTTIGQITDHNKLRTLFSFLSTVQTVTGLENPAHAQKIKAIVTELIKLDKSPAHFDLFLTIVETFASDLNEKKFKFIDDIFQMILQKNQNKSKEILEHIAFSADIKTILDANNFLNQSTISMIEKDILPNIIESPFKVSLSDALTSASCPEILGVLAPEKRVTFEKEVPSISQKQKNKINAGSLSIFMKKIGIYEENIGSAVLNAPRENLEVIFSALGRIPQFTRENSSIVKTIIKNLCKIQIISIDETNAVQKIIGKFKKLTKESDLVVLSHALRIASSLNDSDEEKAEIIENILRFGIPEHALRYVQDIKNMSRIDEKNFPEHSSVRTAWDDFKGSFLFSDAPLTPENKAASVHFFSLLNDAFEIRKSDSTFAQDVDLESLAAAFHASTNKTEFIKASEAYVKFNKALITKFLVEQKAGQSEEDFALGSMSSEETLLAARFCSYLSARDSASTYGVGGEFRNLEDNPVLAFDLFSYYRPHEDFYSSHYVTEEIEANAMAMLQEKYKWVATVFDGNENINLGTLFRAIGYRENTLVMHHPVINFLVNTAKPLRELKDLRQKRIDLQETADAPKIGQLRQLNFNIDAFEDQLRSSLPVFQSNVDSYRSFKEIPTKIIDGLLGDLSQVLNLSQEHSLSVATIRQKRNNTFF